MASLWTARFIVIVEAARRNPANQLAAQWDPDSGGGNTFGPLALSPSGLPPATHYGTNTAATPTMRDGITQALANISWARMYWTANALAPDPVWTGPGGWTFTGQPYPAWLAALRAAGLKLITNTQL